MNQNALFDNIDDIPEPGEWDTVQELHLEGREYRLAPSATGIAVVGVTDVQKQFGMDVNLSPVGTADITPNKSGQWEAREGNGIAIAGETWRQALLNLHHHWRDR